MNDFISSGKDMDDEANTTIRGEFQEPRKKFWMRSRKRPKSDAISVNSMDISIESEVGKKKKRRRITEVASSIFSSGNAGTKNSNVFHRSFTIHSSSVDLSFGESATDAKILNKKGNNDADNRKSFTLRSWLLDVAKLNVKDRLNNSLSPKEVKRQEAIYELYCGENVFLNELCLLRDFYYEPLLSAGIFNSDELEVLFGKTTQLIEIHTRLKDELLSLRDENGYTETVGPTILNWIPLLSTPYLERCRTQIWAKHLLDEKKLTNKRFQSFIKKRLESPHSIDLWTYIDVPRSRIVKYPLLVKEILRHTPAPHSDRASLNEARDLLSHLLNCVDKTMGDAECKLAQSKIHVKVEYDIERCIENATELITEGPLKDLRGMKYQCFLFNTGFALTRRARSATKKFTLSFPVIPKDKISIEVGDKSIENTGFKIGDHLLNTEDEHGRRHWIDSFNKVGSQMGGDTLATEDKENQVVCLRPKKIPARRSIGNGSENHFSLTLKKSFSKHKRSSIGLI